LNFIKYNNLFVTKVNGKWNYCILMDEMDGTVNDLFNKEFKQSDDTDKDEYILDILQQTELLLVIFKHYKYLFTHTDFKLENLFYKIENGKVIIYLGDFDKSSIYIGYIATNRIIISNI